MVTPHDWLAQRLACRQCKDGTLTPQLGQLEYVFDDFHVVVRDVPMSVCDACGHRVIPGPVAVEIDDYVRETVASLRRAALARAHTLELDRLDLTYRESQDRELALA